MTRREAVNRAIAHEETGDVPYFVQFTGPAAEASREHYGCEDLDAGVENYVRGVGCPWWDWHLPEGGYQSDDPPSYLARTRGYGSYSEFADNLKRLRDTTDCYILVMIYGSHFEKAYFARGLESCLADMSGAPAYAHDLFAHIIRKNMVMLENILTFDEVDGVLLGSDWGSQRSLLMSPRIWRDLIAPGEKQEYDLIHSAGKHVWIHSCGCIDAIMPDLVDIGMDVLNPVQPEAMDIARLKADYGDRITFWGGISTQRTLPYGTPDEVREDVRRTIALMGAGGGYITAPSQCLQDDVPIENIVALMDESRRAAGRDPLRPRSAR